MVSEHREKGTSIHWISKYYLEYCLYEESIISAFAFTLYVANFGCTCNISAITNLHLASREGKQKELQNKWHGKKKTTSPGLSFSNAVVWATNAAVLYPHQLCQPCYAAFSHLMLLQQNNKGKKPNKKPPPNKLTWKLLAQLLPFTFVFSYLARRHCNKKTLPMKYQLFNKS